MIKTKNNMNSKNEFIKDFFITLIEIYNLYIEVLQIKIEVFKVNMDFLVY